MYRGTFLISTAVACLLTAWGAAMTASGNVDLTFQPSSESAPVGGYVEIDLIATSDSGMDEAVGAIDAILTWDPAYLELAGVVPNTAWLDQGFLPNSDGLNDGINPHYPDVPANDGNAMYTVFANPGGPPIVAPPPPDSLVVVTFRFRALAVTDETTLGLLPSFGLSSFTNVYALSPPGTIITGDISGTSTIAIVSGSQLRLEVAGDCLNSEIVEVELWMRNLIQNITGFQAFLEYDDAAMQYRGDLSEYTSTPFPVHFGDILYAETSPGEIDLNGGVSFSNPDGTDQDSLLATLRFEVLTECDTTEVHFREVTGFQSELSFEGVPVPTELVDSPLFYLDYTPPEVSGCPVSVALDNDPGLCSAVVTWVPPTASDNCGGEVAVSPPAQDPGDPFPVGTTTVTYTFSDSCGNEATCSFDVTVNDVEPPSITCSADVAVGTDVGVCYATGVDLSAPSTDDNCGVETVTNDAPAQFPVGDTVVTWTVTDIHGNTNTCTQTVTVTDDEDPTITECAESVTLDADETCQGQVPDLTGGVVASDNCDSELDVTQDPVAGTWVGVGDTVVTLTVTDDSGNSATCQATVTVQDVTLPTITCPADVSISADAGVCYATGVELGTPTTDDNCGVETVTNDAPAQFPVGDTVVTWTVTDIHGNSNPCVQTVTVVDDEDPAITECAESVTLDADETCQAQVPDLTGGVVASDNCDSELDVTQEPVAGTWVGVGDTIVTLTVADDGGNSANCQATVTVQDVTLPTITCPEDVSVSADEDVCYATGVDLGTPSTDDNCGVETVTNDAPDQFPVGDTVVTWTVTDVHGNTNTCTQTVTVADDEDPTITCPDDISVMADEGVCYATGVDLGTPSTDDNCGVETVTNDAPAQFPVGDTVVTWTVTDVHGNSNTCTQTVTVVDDEDPAITECAESVTLDADETCQAQVPDLTGGVVASDNCDSELEVTQEPVAGTWVGVGDTVVTLTVTDDVGNYATCQTTVTVQDATPPEITACTDPATLDADESCQAQVPDLTGGVVASDNCDSELEVTQEPVAGTWVGVGDTVVTLRATDDVGNYATCQTTVTVQDVTLPTITCPADVVVGTDAGVCYAAGVELGTPSTDDNCGVETVTNDAPDQFSVGDTVVTWTVADIHGNTNTCMQVVTVTDDEAPAITCPADVSVSTDAGLCEATDVDLGAPAVEDNCGVDTVVNDAPAQFAIGDTLVTWTVMDIHGNSSTCTQTVTVSDDEAPTITCPADISQPADAGSCETYVTVPAADVADNCGVDTVTNDYTGTADASETYSVGTTVVTWTVTDVWGNTNTCEQNITVTDDQDPTIACPDDITVNADAGACSVYVSIPPPTTDDNCDIASVINDYNGTADASDVYPAGSTTVIWTVTDIGGNTASCTQAIMVNAVNELIVDIELSPLIAAGTLTRCVTLELWECPEEFPAVTVEQEIVFTSGLATGVLIDVPCGNYTCITARDTLHTLRRTDSDQFGVNPVAGTQYVADFTDRSAMNGDNDALVGGNLDDSAYIDVIDFGLFSSEWGVSYGDGDTHCGELAPHADVNGDGLVNTADFTFIQINYLRQHDLDCCELPSPLRRDQDLIRRISVGELEGMGLGELAAGDLNDDGWLDEADIEAFLRGVRPDAGTEVVPLEESGRP